MVDTAQCTQKLVYPIEGSVTQKTLSNEAPSHVGDSFGLPTNPTKNLIGVAKAFNVATLRVSESQTAPCQEKERAQNNDFYVRTP